MRKNIKKGQKWFVSYKNFGYDDYSGIVTVLGKTKEGWFECKFEIPKVEYQETGNFTEENFIEEIK